MVVQRILLTAFIVTAQNYVESTPARKTKPEEHVKRLAHMLATTPSLLEMMITMVSLPKAKSNKKVDSVENLSSVHQVRRPVQL
jgi:hypothetical protein